MTDNQKRALIGAAIIGAGAAGGLLATRDSAMPPEPPATEAPGEHEISPHKPYRCPDGRGVAHPSECE